jgi:hypothetical protein
MTTARKARLTSRSSNSRMASCQLDSSSRRMQRRKVSSGTRTSTPRSRGRLKTISSASTASKEAARTTSMATTFKTISTGDLSRRSLMGQLLTNFSTTLADSQDWADDASSFHQPRVARTMVRAQAQRRGHSILEEVCSSISSRALIKTDNRMVRVSFPARTFLKRCKTNATRTWTLGWLRSLRMRSWSVR